MAVCGLTLRVCTLACLLSVFALADEPATPEQLYKSYLDNLDGKPDFRQAAGKKPVSRTTFEEALKAGDGI